MPSRSKPEFSDFELRKQAQALLDALRDQRDMYEASMEHHVRLGHRYGLSVPEIAIALGIPEGEIRRIVNGGDVA